MKIWHKNSRKQTVWQLAQALQGSEQELNSSLLGSQYVQSPGENFTWFLELRSRFHSTYTSLCTGYIFQSDLKLRIPFGNGMVKPRPTFKIINNQKLLHFTQVFIIGTKNNLQGAVRLRFSDVLFREGSLKCRQLQTWGVGLNMGENMPMAPKHVSSSDRSYPILSLIFLVVPNLLWPFC